MELWIGWGVEGRARGWEDAVVGALGRSRGAFVGSSVRVMRQCVGGRGVEEDGEKRGEG